MADAPLPERVVTIVLVSRQGELLGSLPPFPVETPWWQEVKVIVDGARRLHGLEVVVLRLLETELGVMPGGRLTYLAEVRDPLPQPPPLPLLPWPGSLADHPLRMPWASPGGPDADVAWAVAALAERGITPSDAPVQMRSWNLSSLWRIPTDDGAFWLKCVPGFFAHEGRILERLQAGPARVPTLVAADGYRTLLAEIPGEDLYGARPPLLHRMVEHLVGLQRSFFDRTDELLALGLPDWRAAALTTAVADVVDRAGGGLPSADRSVLEGFLQTLDDRLADADSHGLPYTLVHGDFHPGNFRGEPDGDITLLDWGDSGVGHPLLDEPAFLERMNPDDVAVVRTRWHALWRAAVPGSDPERAAALLAPVAAARQAVIYQKFLDNIESAERPYHADDPANWLAHTAEVIRQAD